MKTTLRRMLALCILLLTSLTVAVPTQAAPATCTASVTTVTTDIGPTITKGNTIFYTNYTYTGSYAAGTLAGATFKGTQQGRENIRTQQVRTYGRYLITSPTGTLVTTFTIEKDDTTGDLHGTFTSSQGTGTLAHAHWVGTIKGTFVSADDQGRPTYQSTFKGPCSNLN